MSTEINGKDHNAPKARPKSLDEIWGFKVSKFPTNSEEEYSERLKKMNKADLQNECLRIHEIPHDERPRMLEKLMKQFRRWNTANTPPVVDAKTAQAPNVDKLARARRIIADLTGSAIVEF